MLSFKAIRACAIHVCTWVVAHIPICCINGDVSEAVIVREMHTHVLAEEARKLYIKDAKQP